MAHPIGTRLLLADDDPNVLLAYVFFFSSHGYDIRTARDGAGALAQSRAWLPAVVVLDIQMPSMNGWAVARD